MAKHRKQSLGERVRRKRLASSRPPPSKAAQVPEPLRVEPLAPPPAFAQPLPEPPAAAAPAPVADVTPRAVESEGVARPDVGPSLAPVASTPEPEAPAVRRPSPWKQRVALVAAFAACVGLTVGLKLRQHRGTSATSGRPVPAHVEAAAPPETAELPAFPAPPPPPPTEPEAAAPSASAPSARVLRDEALHLLEKFKNREAIVKATAALDADPTDAMPYLVLGSALQDTGNWREAHRVYEHCSKTAKHGMVYECRAMLRTR